MAIIFQDGFDGGDWDCDQIGPGGTPSPWAGHSGTGSPWSSEYGGVTHYAGEIRSPGRNGTGGSLRQWRHGSFTTGFQGALEAPPFPANTYREIYNRWYMKIPSDFDTTGNLNYLKLWRYFIKVQGGTTNEIYVNFVGSSFSGDAVLAMGTSAWQFDPHPPALPTVLLSHADLPRDDNWHCYEIRIKLNSAQDVADGIYQFWFDGSLTESWTNIDFHCYANDYFTNYSYDTLISCSCGLGNTQASGFQTEWRAIEFDDFVVSTEYVGLDDGSASASPSGSPSSEIYPIGAKVHRQNFRKVHPKY